MLSLIEGTKLRVIAVGTGRTELQEVQNLGDHAWCYDTYGERFRIDITKAEKDEKRVFVMAAHGEAMVFGDGTRILCREAMEPAWKRKLLVDTNADAFVRLPQKKIYSDPKLFDAMDYDKEGMFLTAETVKGLMPLMEAASTLGVTVDRRRTEKRIDVSVKRPVCFANKLFNGNFEVDIELTLSGLCASGVVQQWKPFDKEFIEETTKTGVIFEGNCLYNDLPLLPPKTMENTIPVWHVQASNPEDELKPVELVWILS